MRKTSSYLSCFPFPSKNMTTEGAQRCIYDFTVKDILKNDVILSKYREKVLLIVNVASECGLTGCYYKDLNILYERYRNLGLEILAFPSNQFLEEPRSNKEIEEFAHKKMKAEFPIFDKIDVNGKIASPLFEFLKSKKWGCFGPSIEHDFTKFLVDREGKVVDRYRYTTSPLMLERDIQCLLTTPFQRTELESVSLPNSQGEKILLSIKAVRQACYPSTLPLPSKNLVTELGPRSIYDFTVKDIHGDDVTLSKYRGKVLLIVNVASNYGAKEQYKLLNMLYEKYRTLGFEIVAFPSNKEPGSNKEIWKIARKKFKAKFPIFDKIDLNGKNASPLYKFLKSKKSGCFGPCIKSNFTKFLLDREGKVVDRYCLIQHPLKIESDIKCLLAVLVRTKELGPVTLLPSSQVTIYYDITLVYKGVNICFASRPTGPDRLPYRIFIV